jgi:hypothetical protein
LSQSPVLGFDESSFPGGDEFKNAIIFAESNMPIKNSGYLQWDYPALKRGQILATPINEGNDKLDILSVWVDDEPIISVLAADSDSHYDRIQMFFLQEKIFRKSRKSA